MHISRSHHVVAPFALVVAVACGDARGGGDAESDGDDPTSTSADDDATEPTGLTDDTDDTDGGATSTGPASTDSSGSEESDSSGGDEPGTANVWVDEDGGNCVRFDPPSVYVDADACETFDLAWDAASAGDTIRVKAATYEAQTITDDKTSETFIFAEDGTRTGSIIADASWMTLENLIADAGEEHGEESGAAINAPNVTFRDVSLYGPYVCISINAEFFLWQRGSLGEDGVDGGERRCDNFDSEPVNVNADNATLDGIRFNPQKAALGTDPSCGDDSTFHLENVRVQGAANFHLRNSWFLAGSDAGSGHVFITTTSPDDVQPTGFVAENNVWEPVNGSTALQSHANVTDCGSYVVAYNLMYQGMAFQCGQFEGMQWIGNLGPKGTSSCDEGSYVGNVWQNEFDVACGSDLWVEGPSDQTGNLGIAADGVHLDAGSPAIDAAESDYCTTTLGAVDREGNPRPLGTTCDAGPHERR